GGNGKGENGNGGDGNGNGNGGGYGYNFRGFMPARECTYQDFLKCQPFNFSGTEGVIGLTRWFEKMEIVFHISNCPEKYQMKTREGVNEQSDRRMAEALRARNAVRNLGPLMGDGGEQEEVSGNGGNGNGKGENGNGGDGNGNGNGGGYGYNFRGFMPARECTYQDFLKCQPLNFSGTEGVIGLTRWFEKMETVFHISNCPEKYQMKYASCMLLNSALTWWNSHKRTIGIE
nr:putative reverse transcriptase domain-containing protein [Tanacetum cinerariifolium]